MMLENKTDWIRFRILDVGFMMVLLDSSEIAEMRDYANHRFVLYAYTRSPAWEAMLFSV
jgi:hypothetical protein